MKHLCQANPKLFWRKIKHQNKRNRDCAEKLEIDELYEHFKSFSNEDDPDNQEIDPNITNRNFSENEEHIDEDLDREISMIELVEAVFSQKKMAKAVN